MRKAKWFFTDLRIIIISPARIIMLLFYNMIIIETVSYFYGISNLNITNSNSWSYHTIIFRYGNENLLHLFVIFLTLSFSSTVVVYLFNKDSMGDIQKLKTFIWELVILFIYSVFISIFVFDEKLTWGKILVLFLVSNIWPILYYILKKSGYKKISFNGLLCWFFIFLIFVIIFNFYIGKNYIYPLTVAPNYGYLKDIALLWLILLLISIIPQFLKNDLHKNKNILIIAILGLVLIIWLAGSASDVYFPDSTEGKVYIQKVYEYNVIKQSKNELSVVNEFLKSSFEKNGEINVRDLETVKNMLQDLNNYKYKNFSDDEKMLFWKKYGNNIDSLYLNSNNFKAK